MAAERVSMNAMMRRGAMTSTLITFIMFVTSIFVVGGNAWYGISAGTLVMMFTYTYNVFEELCRNPAQSTNSFVCAG